MEGNLILKIHIWGWKVAHCSVENNFYSTQHVLRFAYTSEIYVSYCDIQYILLKRGKFLFLFFQACSCAQNLFWHKNMWEREERESQVNKKRIKYIESDSFSFIVLRNRSEKLAVLQLQFFFYKKNQFKVKIKRKKKTKKFLQLGTSQISHSTKLNRKYRKNYKKNFLLRKNGRRRCTKTN